MSSRNAFSVERPPRRPALHNQESRADYVVDRWDRLAPGGLHYLADEKLEDALVADLNLVTLSGFFDDFAGGLLDGSSPT